MYIITYIHHVCFVIICLMRTYDDTVKFTCFSQTPADFGTYSSQPPRHRLSPLGRLRDLGHPREQT